MTRKQRVQKARARAHQKRISKVVDYLEKDNQGKFILSVEAAEQDGRITEEEAVLIDQMRD